METETESPPNPAPDAPVFDKEVESLVHPPRAGRKWGSKVTLSPEAKLKMAALANKMRAQKAILEKKREILQAIAVREAELAWRKKNWKIKYYAFRPDGSHPGMNPVQEKFHRMKNQIRVISGSNRLGKSEAGVNEDVAYALGYRPWLKPEDPDYKIDVRIPNKGLICGESFQVQVKTVLIPKLLGNPETGESGAIPSEELAATHKNPQGVITQIAFKNGSTIFLMSYDQETDLFESADFDWIHFDEPPPRAIFIAAYRGLTDRAGKCWFTMTPIKEPWVYDEIYCDKTVGIVYGAIEENLGFGMDQKGIDQLKARLRPDEAEARLRGRPLHLQGLVYGACYKDIHRIPRARLFARGVPRHWALWMHIDCHPRKAQRAVWIAVAPDQRKYIVGEARSPEHPQNLIAPFCEQMRVYEQTVLKYPSRNIVRLIDPLSGTPNPIQEGLTMWDEFDAHGFTCKPGSKNLSAGIQLFKNELQSDPAAGIYPNIFFVDDLEGVHYEMNHYLWDDHGSKKSAEKYDEKQTPRPKHDDFIQGIHRILLDSPFCGEETYSDTDPTLDLLHAGANPFTGY